MKLVPIRTVVYLAAFALPAVAQAPSVTMSRTSQEMSRLEVSVGAVGMEAGPGRDLEKQMTALGLQSGLGRYGYPFTEPPNIIPGAFLQANVAMTVHTMAGVLADVLETTTHGRTPDGLSMSARANIKTRAVLASFRPTPWIKVEAGPALMHRLLEFESTGIRTADDAIGFVAGADAKFVRKPMTPEHPPLFGYATAQYRAAPSMRVPSVSVPLFGSPQPHSVTWPAQHLRTSHWVIGLGIGFEI
jgi:hypothetical protein